jgi:hypothetical protein
MSFDVIWSSSIFKIYKENMAFRIIRNGKMQKMPLSCPPLFSNPSWNTEFLSPKEFFLKITVIHK